MQTPYPLPKKKKLLVSRQLSSMNVLTGMGKGSETSGQDCGSPNLDQFRLLKHHTLRLLQLKNAGK